MVTSKTGSSRSRFRRIHTSVVTLSAIALSGCAQQSYDNAYELWQALEPHVDCAEDNLRISQEPGDDTFPAHTQAICTPADISGSARIETPMEGEYGFFLNIRVVDDSSEAATLTTRFEGAPHAIVGDGWAVGAGGSFTDDAEIVLESWLEEVQEDIGGEIQ